MKNVHKSPYLRKRLEVPGRFGHLLTVEEKVPIASEGPWPLFLSKDGGVVVQGEREVIL
jgi:hypothetical protein